MMRGKIFFFSGLLVMLAFGWFAYPNALYRRTQQPLQFSHKVHTGEKGGMKCEDCHSIREDGTFSGVPVLDKCSGCHGAPMGSTADEKLLIDRYVTPNRGIPWLVYARQPDNVYFPHAEHVTLARLSCAHCHGQHGSTDRLRPLETNRISTYSRDIGGPSVSWIGSPVKNGMRMDDCVRCHNQRSVTTGCLDCHK